MKIKKICLSVAAFISFSASPSFAGQGITVFFANFTNNRVDVRFDAETCWYPNDMGNNFSISGLSHAQKYTEIKSSGSCPSQASRLYFRVSEGGNGATIQLKGTNGDNGGNFQNICTDSKKGFSILAGFDLPKNFELKCAGDGIVWIIINNPS